MPPFEGSATAAGEWLRMGIESRGSGALLGSWCCQGELESLHDTGGLQQTRSSRDAPWKSSSHQKGSRLFHMWMSRVVVWKVKSIVV